VDGVKDVPIVVKGHARPLSPSDRVREYAAQVLGKGFTAAELRDAQRYIEEELAPFERALDDDALSLLAQLQVSVEDALRRLP
jgi:hypothetical protein